MFFFTFFGLCGSHNSTLCFLAFAKSIKKLKAGLAVARTVTVQVYSAFWHLAVRKV